MGFLDSIGQRGEPRPQSSPPPIVQDPAPPAPQPWEPERTSRSSVTWIAVVIVIAAVGVGAWLGLRKLPTQAPPASAVSPDAPPAEQVSADKANPKGPSKRRTPILHSTAAHSPSIETEAPAPAPRQPDETSEANDGAPVADVAESAATPAPPLTDPPAALLEAAALLKTWSEDDSIYSRESSGVVVPRLVSLGFVHPLISGFQTRSSTLELLVSKSGTVEHARVASSSGNWEDAILLSRAKTFQFVPAQRNGSPVRYRLLMNVVTTP